MGLSITGLVLTKVGSFSCAGDLSRPALEPGFARRAPGGPCPGEPLPEQAPLALGCRIRRPAHTIPLYSRTRLHLRATPGRGLPHLFLQKQGLPPARRACRPESPAGGRRHHPEVIHVFTTLYLQIRQPSGVRTRRWS